MNNRSVNIVGYITLSLTFIIILVVIGAFAVPWYKTDTPHVTDQSHYHPGEEVGVVINRRALVDLKGTLVRELVRNHEGVDYEILKATTQIILGKGKKTIVVYYPLPPCCGEAQATPCVTYEENTYYWSGSITYKILGVFERTHYFKTKPFQIMLKGHKE